MQITIGVQDAPTQSLSHRTFEYYKHYFHAVIPAPDCAANSCLCPYKSCDTLLIRDSDPTIRFHSHYRMTYHRYSREDTVIPDIPLRQHSSSSSMSSI